MSKLMTGAGLLALSTGFAAAAPAVVQNDLNLRAGPGPDYEVIAAMPAGSTVDVMGCQSSWCQVAFGDTTGFASRAFLGLGGPVASGPASRGYAESYASGGYAPAYGDGGPAYGQSYGTYDGERTFGNARRFGAEGSVRTERRFSEQGAARAERRSGEQGAVRGLNDEGNARGARVSAGADARGGEERAQEIQGVNPMLNAKGSAAAGASANARAEARGSANERRGAANVSEGANARATTGASTGSSGGDNGPNFLGPKAKDNHP